MTVAEYYAYHAQDGRAFLPEREGYSPFRWIVLDKRGYCLCSSSDAGVKPLNGSDPVDWVSDPVPVKVRAAKIRRYHVYH